jgi:DNA-binding FrmR family transcriptional regulator
VKFIEKSLATASIPNGEILNMAHIEHSDHLRDDLLAHRNRIEALLDRLERGLSCVELLNGVHDCHRELGQIRSGLLVEHLHHHLAKENDRSRRDQAAHEIAALFLDNS